LPIGDGATLPSPMGNDLQFVIGAGDGYFQALGQRIVRGRTFAPGERAGADTSGTAPVVVSESFARAAWRGADPIGRCVRRDEKSCAPVIGVARDVAYMSLRDTSVLVVYKPMSALGGAAPTLQIMARTSGDDVARVAREVRAVLQGMDPRMPYVNGYPLLDNPGVRSQLAPYRLGAAAFALFGALALVVAAVGLYAVVAYSVARRTGEIGVRVALGAQAANIRRLVLGEGARHALVGCVVGIALGAAATRLLRAKLYGVAPFDVPTFAVATVVLVATALLASWLPARRAAAIPPTEALRSD